MNYTADQLVLLAKRENNSIRPYLFVNPMQGKHIPTDPRDAIGMCQAIAEKVNDFYPDDLLYVIGFAETATGIASCITSFLKNAVYYQNTTREFNDKDCILFSEVHSHATDQLLRAEGIDRSLKRINRILFIDDEVTTGNTICNLINMIKGRYAAEDIRFSIVSVLNSMSEERYSELRQQGIDCLYLDRIPYEYKKDSILDVSYNPDKHILAQDNAVVNAAHSFVCPVNPRNIVSFQDYMTAVRDFAEMIRISLLDDRVCLDKMLVLGTEEFMYPTFVVGEMLRQQGYAKTVRIHSTSRSPIIASEQKGYPLYCRYQIRSPYDSKRTTFVYNLQQYDRVFVLTDATDCSVGLSDLCKALSLSGNKNVTIVRWQYTEEGGNV